MNNFFAKPHTPGQWLLSSLCWTVSCVGGWFIIYYAMSQVAPADYHSRDILLSCYFWPAHLLIWWRAVHGGLRWLHPKLVGTTALSIAGSIWLALLTVLQIIMLIMGLFATFIILFFNSFYHD